MSILAFALAVLLPVATQDRTRVSADLSQETVRVGSKQGLVIRVGLPEWYAKLDDPNVQQVTYNIIDLLRRVTPKIRTVGQ